jgi:hypothetical protein
MGSYAKVDAVYDSPFWRAEGLTGQAVSVNGPVRVTFDSTPKGGSPGVLLGFIGGTDARRWYGLPAEQRRQTVLENLANYFGEKARNPLQYIENRWADERYSRGDPVAGLPVCCSTSAPPCERPSGASTGRGPRPPTSGSATWTAPCAQGSGQRRKCSPNSRRHERPVALCEFDHERVLLASE